MGEVGILKPTDRVELIRGEIVEKSPIGRRHYAFGNNLNQLLAVRLAGRAIVASRVPSLSPTTPSPSRTSPSSGAARCPTRSAKPTRRTRSC